MWVSGNSCQDSQFTEHPWILTGAVVVRHQHWPQAFSGNYYNSDIPTTLHISYSAKQRNLLAMHSSYMMNFKILLNLCLLLNNGNFVWNVNSHFFMVLLTTAMDYTSVLSLLRTLSCTSHISVIWCCSLKMERCEVKTQTVEWDWYKRNPVSLSWPQDLLVLVSELCECDPYTSGFRKKGPIKCTLRTRLFRNICGSREVREWY